MKKVTEVFASLPQDPLDLFSTWLEEATEREPNDPTAMSVASVGEDGMPSSRMVLLKDFDERGFVFYTNFGSRKGQQILKHPKVALLFHWKTLLRQVRIEGEVEQVSDAEADAYHRSRPRQSQIGAWASRQSETLESRFALEKRVAKYAARYPVGTVPRPEFWSGFRVKPRYLEFWKDSAFRLHDRVVYEPGENGWVTRRLYP